MNEKLTTGISNLEALEAIVARRVTDFETYTPQTVPIGLQGADRINFDERVEMIEATETEAADITDEASTDALDAGMLQDDDD